MEYRIIEENEDKTAIKIEKKGMVHVFTLAEIERDTKLAEKMKKELSAQRDLEKAKIDNIESFHPFVLSLSPEDMSTISLYFDAKGRYNQCIGKIEEIDEMLKDGAEEMEEILEQLPQLKDEK